MQTTRSQYIFHLPSYPVRGSLGFFEGYFKNTVLNYNPHYHKIMTEIFTVTHGEFYFILGQEEYVFCTGDTAIIPPGVVHGFRPRVPESRLQFIFTDTEDREDFFNGLAKIVNGEITLNDEELEAFYNRHDQYSVKG
ncbi:MAG TPA: cupin domain-containing protein [Chitinophagaceae bacterium]|nr:cupin domain-containing protein [Chitinophagaceae bacterium]